MVIASRISSWSGGGDSAYWGLYFEAEEAGCVVNMNKYAATNTVSLEGSTDGGATWSDFDGNSNTGTTPVTLANIGDRVYFRTKGSTVGNPFSTGDMKYRYFTLSKKAGAHGNIMSLARGDIKTTVIPSAYYFYALFDSCANLTSAPKLPATTLTNYCYDSMFYDCSGLEAAPELPATALAMGCYYYMFYGCTSLASATELKASSVSQYGYAYMFYGCTSLTTAPAMSATSIGSHGCDQMYYGCTALTTVPNLTATTLAADCCNAMFQGCTSLVTPPNLPATTIASNCYASMFRGCTALTTAPNLPSITIASGCYKNMFYGCTSLAAAPVLGATTLQSYCYAWMFKGCSNLSSVHVKFTAWGSSHETDDWLANVAANGTFTCPDDLGDGSTITRGASYCPSNWTVENPNPWWMYFEAEEAGAVVAMANEGNPPAVTLETSTDEGATWTTFTPGTTSITLANIGDRVYFRAGSGGNTGFASNESWYRYFTLSKKCGAHGNIMSLLDGTDYTNVTIPSAWCFSTLFYYCGGLTAAPSMPATTLAAGCYYRMFYGCSNLVTMPTLPAMTAVDECYKWMFYYCTALAGNITLPATTLAYGCYDAMFAYCSRLNGATLGGTSLVTNCYGWMFYGCNALNSLTVNFTDWNPGSYSPAPTVSWMGGASTGTFTCPTALGTNATIQRGSGYCPNNWTVINI